MQLCDLEVFSNVLLYCAVVLGGYNFFLEQKVKDLLKDIETKQRREGRMPPSPLNFVEDNDDNDRPGPMAPKGGLNRSDKRLKNKLDKQ